MKRTYVRLVTNHGGSIHEAESIINEVLADVEVSGLIVAEVVPLVSDRGTITGWHIVAIVHDDPYHG